jgi:hypothetical protein
LTSGASRTARASAAGTVPLARFGSSRPSRGRSRPASYRALDERSVGNISSKVHDAVRGVPVDGKVLHILDF